MPYYMASLSFFTWTRKGPGISIVFHIFCIIKFLKFIFIEIYIWNQCREGPEPRSASSPSCPNRTRNLIKLRLAAVRHIYYTIYNNLVQYRLVYYDNKKVLWRMCTKYELVVSPFKVKCWRRLEMVKGYFKILVLVQLESINSFQPIYYNCLLWFARFDSVVTRQPPNSFEQTKKGT